MFWEEFLRVFRRVDIVNFAWLPFVDIRIYSFVPKDDLLSEDPFLEFWFFDKKSNAPATKTFSNFLCFSGLMIDLLWFSLFYVDC